MYLRSQNMDSQQRNLAFVLEMIGTMEKWPSRWFVLQKDGCDNDLAGGLEK